MKPLAAFLEAPTPAAARQRALEAALHGTVECLECKERFRPLYPEDRSCDACREKRRIQLRARESKPEALRGSGAPPEIRKKFFEPGHPLAPPWWKAWPQDRRFDLGTADWTGKPKTLLLIGTNGSGKSMIAGELLFRCRRAGVDKLRWTDFLDLQREENQGGFQPRARWEAARAADVTVLDDIGARGQLHPERAWGLVLELLNARSRRPTILTAHIPFGRRGGAGSIEELAPAVYSRLLKGLVVGMQGHGDWRSYEPAVLAERSWT